jgi:hypothetical protein
MSEASTGTDIAALMEPFFQLIGHTPLNIAPERRAELIAEVFKGQMWELFATKGAPRPTRFGGSRLPAITLACFDP